VYCSVRLRQLAVSVVLVSVASLMGCAPASTPTATSDATPEPSLPTAYDGNPDLSGIWQAIGTAHWNLEDHTASAGPPELGAIGTMPPGKGVVVGGDIPYQEWAREQQQENLARRHAEDPATKCYLPGVPRATYQPYPFQILQGTGKIMIVYGIAEANRTIHMDKDNPEPAPIDSWMGRSHGRWDGDTLVVEASGFNGQAWLDRAGNFASDTLRIEERYTLMGPNAMQYEATLEDPNVYTGTWSIKLPLYRRLEPDMEILEYKCVEYSEELIYGHLRKRTAQ
jgi:hypothetical protein